MHLIHATTRAPVAALILPRNAWELHLGLLVRPPLRAGEGLWLNPCGGIHTLGMRYPIDVLFLDRDLRILRIAASVPPWQIRLAPTATRSVVELPAGAATALRAGERLQVVTGERTPGARVYRT